MILSCFFYSNFYCFEMLCVSSHLHFRLNRKSGAGDERNYFNNFKMKKIKRLNCEQIIYIFTLICFILLIVFFINNYKKTNILEKERIRINREIYLKEVISKKKEKEFNGEEQE